ncbi:peptidase S8/S53 domain-containing protein [Fusarium tricinctum]|uniref:Peptidase S8/S53 domain-containing protein n=1 Tax=Fusarium tricinctum TaxID=61284 RepID=A0A8K0RWW6_9HYPO|nr:peptidase S8/S53 domain-containing protein [Fusarium tricinctum]
MVNLKNIFLTATIFLGCGLAVPAPAAPQAEAGAIIPGSYIITLKPDIDAIKVKSHIRWVKDVHKRSLTKRETEVGVEKIYDSKTGFQGYAGSFDTTTIKEIKKSSDVVAVEPNRVWKIKRVQSKRNIEKRDEITQKKATWGLGTISHRKKGSKEYIYDDYAGTDMYAYVIDTGVRTSHKDFGGRAKAAWTNWKGDNSDTDGHGTHVAGTIGGKTYGVVKEATILALKVFKGDESDTSIVLDAFNWAVNDIIKKDRTWRAVINMSLGGEKSTAFNKAVDAASKKGVVSVVASGNDGIDSAKESPGSASSAITVGAVDSNWAVADFSNWGKTVDILAPGVEIISTGHKSNTATATLDGTSMACPHVAGLVLYAMSVEEVEGVADITAWLKESATPKKITGNLRGAPNLIANNGNYVQ